MCLHTNIFILSLSLLNLNLVYSNFVKIYCQENPIASQISIEINNVIEELQNFKWLPCHKKTRTESFNSGFKSGRMDSNHRYPAPKAGAIAARRRPESTKASICEKENEVNSKCKFCYCFSKVKASRKEWFCICFLVWLGKKINKRLYTPFEFAL